LTVADNLPTLGRIKPRITPWSPEEGEQYELVLQGNASVKIYRRARSGWKGKRRWIYEVVDYLSGPRRLRGFGQLDKARDAAKGIAKGLASGKAAVAAMTNADAAVYGKAVEILRPTGLSLEVAAAIVANAIKILGSDRIIEAANYFQGHRAGELVHRSVSEVVKELIHHRQARGKSRRYINDIRARLNRFAESFAVDISTVTTKDVQKWLDKLKLAPRTVRNFQGTLGTLFSFAESRGYLAKGTNPMSGAEKISPNGDGAIEIYSPQEISALLEHAPREFVPFLVLGAFAGLRSAEIERLEWSDVDLGSGFITVAADKAKTRSRRLVPIAENLRQWLSNYAHGRGMVWNGSERDLLDARAATVKAAKTFWKDNALRHSYISYRLAQVQDAAQVALEAGNSPNMVFRHYRELVKPETAMEWFEITPK
jgi:integrase